MYKRQLVSSAWSEIWCYGEGDLDRELCIEREMELYKLKRNYNQLRERLEGVKINNIKLYKRVCRAFSPCWPLMEVTLSVTPNTFRYLLGHMPPQQQQLNS